MEALLQKHQRDLNRLVDADRMARRRGLQDLLKDLPWAQRDNVMREMVLTKLLGGTQPLLATIADTVEKCRETTLALLNKCLDNCSAEIPLSVLTILVEQLCKRVNDAPFPEPTEELRLQVVELVGRIVQLPVWQEAAANSSSSSSVVGAPGTTVELILHALTRALVDPFPSAKRACAELVTVLAEQWPQSVSAGGTRKLLNSLYGNAQHQHSKTRVVTVRAIGCCMGCLVERGSADYEALLKEPFLALFHILSADAAAGTRRELATQVGALLGLRLKSAAAAASLDLDLAVLLLLLTGDEAEDVAEAASSALEAAAAAWSGRAYEGESNFFDNAHIVDGEQELQRQADGAFAASAGGIEGEGEEEGEEEGEGERSKMAVVGDDSAASSSSDVGAGAGAASRLFLAHLLPVSQLLVSGVSGWTVESRKRYLRGLDRFLLLVASQASALLPSLVAALGPACRDEDLAVRAAAEAAACHLGSFVKAAEALDVVLPRVQGLVPGSDTATARAHAARALTCFVRGFAQPPPSPFGPFGEAEAEAVAKRVATAASDPAAFEYKEPFLREALLLLLRQLLLSYPRQCSLQGSETERAMVQGLLLLQSHSEGVGAELVQAAARRELARLAGLSSSSSSSSNSSSSSSSSADAPPPPPPSQQQGEGESAAAVAALLSRHFSPILAVLCSGPWDPHSPTKGAFEALLRSAPGAGWEHSERVLSAVLPLVQPPPISPQDSSEATQQSYAAQRGDESSAPPPELSLRLSLLALLEGWVRAGASDWQCGKYLGQSSERLLREGVCRNLVWRVGRVEATARKVALAVAHALLRAGAAPPEALYKIAPELVPLLSSSLDENDTTVRHMGCLCLRVVFERLKGAFGPQAVGELYPLLIKRLDDSSDQIRVEACFVLASFMAAVQAGAFSGTPLDYVLDVLFVHLDDPNPAVQDAVLRVVMQAALLDRALVRRKTEANRTALRSPDIVERLLAL